MKSKAIYVILSGAVTAGIFGYLLRFVSLREVFDLIRASDPRGLATFLLFSFAMSVCRTWRYSLILGAAGQRVGSVALFLVTLVRNTFSDLLPARLGTLVYVYVTTTRLGVPFGAAGSSFALSFLFDILALAPLIAAAAVMAGPELGISPWGVTAGGAVLGAITVALIALLPAAIRLAARLTCHIPFVAADRLELWREVILAVEADIQRAREAGIYFRVLALSVLVRAFKYASLYVFLFALVAPRGYGLASLEVPRVFIGLVSAELAASLPISGIAGFGAYEGAWALVFKLLVFPAQMAQLTSIAHHLFTQVYGYTLGAVALLLLLLPVYGRRRPDASPRRPLRPLAFAAALAAFTGAVLVLGAALYKVAPAAPVRRVAGAVPAEAVQPAPPEGRPPLQGWVVYDRPDGIYKTRVETGETRRLSDGGTNPRWSPDASRIAYLRNGWVMVMRADGSEPRELAQPREPFHISFHPDGSSVIFTDLKAIKVVSIADRGVRTLLTGEVFREPDMTADGRLVTSVRAMQVEVRSYDLSTGEHWTIGRGCSASLSPDGTCVTQNTGGHRTLRLRDWKTGADRGKISSPKGLIFDNQYWSNHPDWIASKSQGAYEDIFVHSVRLDRAWRVTASGSCDRPDLFVTGTAEP